MSGPAADRGRLPLAAIFGCAGLRISPTERSFFRACDPLGFILFDRNIRDPDQVRRLIEDLRGSVGRDDAPVLIDQEGGRVARLKPPHWRIAPPPARFAALYEADPERAVAAARLNAQLIAAELADLGITVDCAPVLDVPQADADPIIGDRAAGRTPEETVVLGQAICDGLLDEGVLPVIKHVPGHGRATVDSHKKLPVVATSVQELDRVDFAPFRALKAMPWAMTAHVVYSAIDADRPATLSPSVVQQVIRDRIGFAGLLLSDDLGMQALEGDMGARAAGALEAGCDVVLHCSGNMDEMEAVAAGAIALTRAGGQRFARGEAMRRRRGGFDSVAARRRLDHLLTEA